MDSESCSMWKLLLKVEEIWDDNDGLHGLLVRLFFICYASADRGIVKIRYQVMLVCENEL